MYPSKFTQKKERIKRRKRERKSQKKKIKSLLQKQIQTACWTFYSHSLEYHQHQQQKKIAWCRHRLNLDFSASNALKVEQVQALHSYHLGQHTISENSLSPCLQDHRPGTSKKQHTVTPHSSKKRICHFPSSCLFPVDTSKTSSAKYWWNNASNWSGTSCSTLKAEFLINFWSILSTTRYLNCSWSSCSWVLRTNNLWLEPAVPSTAMPAETAMTKARRKTLDREWLENRQQCIVF